MEKNSSRDGGVVVSDLTKKFGDSCILSGVGWHFKRGSNTVIIGPNGAGKSTFLAILATLLEADGGVFSIMGVSSPVGIRQLVGYLGHTPAFTPVLTAWENLWLTARMFDVPQPREKIRTLTEEFGITNHVSLPVSALSRGQVQRLGLARTMLHDPPVLLLDEPFTALDAIGTEHLVAAMRRWRQTGKTVIWVTHHVDSVVDWQLADTVLALWKGHLFEAPPDARHDPKRLAAATSIAG